MSDSEYPVQERNEQFSTKGVKGQANTPKQVGSFRQLRIGSLSISLDL